MKDHIVYHKDGSIWAKGQVKHGIPEGYWEWYRKPANPEDKKGIRMRSGYFKDGKQVGDWITYDKQGEIHKVTHFDIKAKQK